MIPPLFNMFMFSHCDMKCDNLYRLDNGSVLLIDFGFSNLRFHRNKAFMLNCNRNGVNTHPTLDLTMLAVSFEGTFPPIITEYKATPRGRAGVYPPVKAAMNTLLLNAVCDTTYAVAAGTMSETIPHESHILDPGKQFNADKGWGDIYKRVQHHNNLRCMPENVFAAFQADPIGLEALIPVPPAPPVPPVISEEPALTQKPNAPNRVTRKRVKRAHPALSPLWV